MGMLLQPAIDRERTLYPIHWPEIAIDTNGIHWRWWQDGSGYGTLSVDCGFEWRISAIECVSSDGSIAPKYIEEMTVTHAFA